MPVQEPVVAYEVKKISQADYLSMEKTSSQKHEYYKGEVFAMAGASPRHNKIHTNLFIGIGLQLKDNPCQPYSSDLRIHVPENTYTLTRIFLSFVEILSHPRQMIAQLPNQSC